MENEQGSEPQHIKSNPGWIYSMEKQGTVIKVESHGTAYYIDQYGRLAGNPIKTDGSVEQETEMEIEQSPIAYKADHEKVLRTMGIPEGLITQILKHVHYY